MSAWQPLLDWWFGADATASASQVAAQRNRLWFGYRAEQDAEAAARFGALTEQALAAEFTAWTATADGWLAHLLLLDQLPRMIYRGTPQAFAGDARAQQLLDWGLNQGLERQLRSIQQVFAFLVLEHAEDLSRQAEAVARFTQLHAAQAAHEQTLFSDYLDYAVRHQQVIARFGRFPHRNAILGRASTPTELRFLSQPGSGF